MCLAKAYLNKWSDEPVLQDISYLRLNGDSVEMATLFNEEKVITGRLVEVDFNSSRILLDEYHKDEKSL